jgi:L-lactate dehydrogenase complex protein LldG
VSARERILARVRAACAAGEPVPPPPPEPAAARALGWDDFGAALAETDGVLHAAVARASLRGEVERLAGGAFLCAHGAAALLGLPAASSEVKAVDDSACLVASGRLAVARTGSILVGASEVPLRAHLLVAQTLILLVPQRALVDDLPEVYASVDAALLPRGYLTLVTGPSRTADIEQTLVTGAHGPRRLLVVPYVE